MNQTAAAQPRVLLLSCGAWYLRETARAFHSRGALAGLWISDKNRTAIPQTLFRRCWPFHLCMKPFYHLAPQIVVERTLYALFPIWRQWLLRQAFPGCEIVQAIMGYASEAFAEAERIGALKVIDCQNSHPTSYYGYWQRECDIWCPGHKVPIPRWMFARMSRELARADLILCPSTFVRDSMVQNGLQAEKCFVNPFGADTALFQPRTEVPKKPRFIAVGTICLRKGHQYLFRAFQCVRREIPDAELICVGDYKTDFRLERPRWEGTFTHVRTVPHAKLAELFQTCSAFVIPSIEEGFARVISEAMSAGLPVIGTYESGSTTQVTDGVDGMIVPSCNPEKLAEAMVQLAQDVNLNRSMGVAARQNGAVENSWQHYGDRLLHEYTRRLQSPGGMRSAGLGM
jgi:glycosyltransferase involved in cell wall biosynthesis